MMSWTEFGEALRKAASRAADAIRTSADVTSLQMRVANEEKRLEDAFTALGKKVYYLRKADVTPEAYREDVAKLDSIREGIRVLNQQICARKEEAANKKAAVKEDAKRETEETVSSVCPYADGAPEKQGSAEEQSYAEDPSQAETPTDAVDGIPAEGNGTVGGEAPHAEARDEIPAEGKAKEETLQKSASPEWTEVTPVQD